MSGNHLTADQSLRLAIRERIDRACARFEASWKTDQEPQIEEYLRNVDEPERSALLRELLHLELNYRRLSGRTLAKEEYESRFPDCATIVAACFRPAPSTIEMTVACKQDTEAACGLHIRCPHCHNPVELVTDSLLTDIVCSSCGSHFSIAGESAETRSASTITTIGHFELIERLGMGAFGTVWKARDTELDRTVAVKIPRKGQLEPAELDQFLREARTAAQLRHPHIVNVHEVGRDGDTVYIVSDIIRGVTLSDWLTGHRLTDQESAELCVQIADALHHAHEKGVIHRDLKPHNIMIDAAGEPHLMDFGLARREAGEITMTVDGQTLGTPAYMSPEQARGEAHTAGRTSDVYSLGVILFQLLTAELPFRGNSRMLIHQVINEPPPTPRKLNSNVSRDLETICLKCLEKEPKQRYASAKELAEELGRFLRREPIHARRITAAARWRWCRRKPAIASLSLTVGFFVLGVAIIGPAAAWREMSLRAMAEQREQEAQTNAELASQYAAEADRNFALAGAAVDKYLITITEDTRLKSSGLQSLRKELLETGRDFYETMLLKKRDDPQLDLARGNAYSQLALITSEIDSPKKAIQLQQKALDIFATLEAQQPRSAEVRNQLAKCHHRLALYFFQVGKNEEAGASLDAALTLWDELINGRVQSALYQLKRAETQSVAAVWHETRAELADAERLNRSTLDVLRQLVEIYPEDDKYKRCLAAVHNNLGSLCHSSGQIDEALTACTLSVEIGRQVVQRSTLPGDRSALALSLQTLGWLQLHIGQSKQAESNLTEALTIRQQLVSDHPDVLAFRVRLASLRQAIGALYLRSYRFDLAEDSFRRALSICDILVQDHPDGKSQLDMLAAVHYHLGGLHYQMQRLTDAETEYLAACAMYEQLCRSEPRVGRYLSFVAHVYNDLSLVYDEMGLSEKTYRAKCDALTRWRELVDAFPENLEYQLYCAVGLNNLGAFHHAAHRLEEARAKYEEALAIRRRLTERRPNVATYEYHLSESYRNIGLYYHDTGRYSDAIRSYGSAWTILARLTEAYPSEQIYRWSLAKHCLHYGSLYCSHTQQIQEGLGQFQAGFALCQRLTEEWPDVPKYRQMLATNRSAAAAVFWRTGETGKAIQAFRLAEEAWETLLLADPDQPAYKADLARCKNNLAVIWSSCDDSSLRDGSKATQRADSARRLTDDTIYSYFDTLAAAHAEAGDFAAAVKWQTKACELAVGRDKEDYASRLELYRNGTPARLDPSRVEWPTCRAGNSGQDFDVVVQRQESSQTPGL